MASLIVNGVEDLHLLDEVPAEVTMITIVGIEDVILLPLLPAHVEQLDISYVYLDEKTRFAEGLKSLSLELAGDESPMTNWVFPSTLEEVTVRVAGFIDLRNVPAPTITVYQNTEDIEVLFPETLDKLTYQCDELVGHYLPTYLRELVLIGTELAEVSVHETVKVLTLVGCQPRIQLGEMFPNLESLILEDHQTMNLVSWGSSRPTDDDSNEVIAINIPELRSLTVDGDGVLLLDTPKLRTLTVIGARFDNAIDLSPNTELAQSLVELVLDNVATFPVATDWERLTSVKINNSPVELPFIQWLEHLETDAPVPTNGAMVSTLEEYKAAWGVTNKPKGVSCF